MKHCSGVVAGQLTLGVMWCLMRALLSHCLAPKHIRLGPVVQGLFESRSIRQLARNAGVPNVNVRRIRQTRIWHILLVKVAGSNPRNHRRSLMYRSSFCPRYHWLYLAALETRNMVRQSQPQAVIIECCQQLLLTQKLYSCHLCS